MNALSAAKAIQQDIVGLRRQVHMQPEIGLETPHTSALVASALKDLGVEVRERVGGWGVVGLIAGKAGGSGGVAASAGQGRRTVALRADMDALPVQEETGKEYASQIPGVMHACGHDAHVAMLLGAARILSGMKKDLTGNVKLLFQPGEESGGGARFMIADGALENPRPDIVLGTHVGTLWALGTGQIGVRPGPLMAASDNFIITVRGRGGHGAAPHLSVDPVLIASHIVVALQTIVSREVDPVTPAVVTVGMIQAGTARNIIPETCVMRGTVRYIDRALAAFMPARVKEIAEGTARAMRGEAAVEYAYGYPPLINDPGATDFLARSASGVVGPENVRTIQPTMGGEDMAYYLEKVPGTFFGLGTANVAKGIVYPNHHPKFDVDEDVLYIGTACLVQVCLDFLGRSEGQ
jgi:amidohydrolase